MVFADDPETVNSCGIALDPAGIAWDLYGGYPSVAVDRARRVFGPCAGAALYRRAMLDQVGLFDSDFFAYLEDVDLAWRARLRGWDCALCPQAVVKHVHSATLGHASPLKRFLLARNKMWLLAKCLSVSDGELRHLPLIALYDVGAAALGAVRGGDWSSVRGRLSGLRTLRGVLAKRAAIQVGSVPRTGRVQAQYRPLAPPWEVPRRYRHLVEPGRGRPFPRANVSDRPRLVVSLRDLALRSLGRALPARPASSPPREPGRVVVLRPDHLGDVLLSRPALELLSRALPSAALTVVAGPWGQASLSGIPVRVVSFPFPGFTRSEGESLRDRYEPLLALASRLRRERFDAALVLRPDHWWGAWAAALAGVPIRVGARTAATEGFLTHSLPLVDGEHTTATALRLAGGLLDAVGVSLPWTAEAPSYPITADGRRTAADWLSANLGRRKSFVVVHPGAGKELKSWPARRWAALCDRLAAQSTVVLSGAPVESDLLGAIQSQSRQPPFIALDLSWDALAALYARARVVVGMDSGPLHLASAVGTPGVRVYGPTDSRIYGPVGRAPHAVLGSRLACAPCGNLDAPPCGFRVHPPCLAMISVDSVATETLNLLAPRRGRVAAGS
jgi:heptosyltransferase-2/heptosyltransferase-3